MKVSTDLSNNFLGCYNEARGFQINKRKILKTKKRNLLSYIERNIIVFVCLFVINMLLNLLCNPWYAFSLIFIISLVEIIYLNYMIVNYLLIYKFRKKQKFKSFLMFDEEGITDESYYGIKMLFRWEKVKAIVIGVHTVTILTDTPCYFYFDIKEKDKLIEVIKKYDNIKKIIN